MPHLHKSRLYNFTLDGIMLLYTIHYGTILHYATLHYTTLPCTALHYTTLPCTALHYTTLHMALRYTTLHQIPKLYKSHLASITFRVAGNYIITFIPGTIVSINKKKQILIY